MVRLPVMCLYWFCLYTAMTYAMFRGLRQQLSVKYAFPLAWLWLPLLLITLAHEVAKGTKELFSKRT